jgi:transposase
LKDHTRRERVKLHEASLAWSHQRSMALSKLMTALRSAESSGLSGATSDNPERQTHVGTRVARVLGVTRETVYATSRRLAVRGVLGSPIRSVVGKAHVKITPAIRDFAVDAKRRDPTLPLQALAEEIATESGVVVHKKTVERLLAAGPSKKPRTTTSPP